MVEKSVVSKAEKLAGVKGASWVVEMAASLVVQMVPMSVETLAEWKAARLAASLDQSLAELKVAKLGLLLAVQRVESRAVQMAGTMVSLWAEWKVAWSVGGLVEK